MKSDTLDGVVLAAKVCCDNCSKASIEIPICATCGWDPDAKPPNSDAPCVPVSKNKRYFLSYG